MFFYIFFIKNTVKERKTIFFNAKPLILCGLSDSITMITIRLWIERGRKPSLNSRFKGKSGKEVLVDVKSKWL